MTHLDGNALSGLFADAFGVDLTSATGRCGSCGHAAELARADAYVSAMGAVLRCRACDSVLGVVVDATGTFTVSLSGLATITMPRDP